MHRDNNGLKIQRVAVIQRGEAALRFLKTADVILPRIEAVLLYTQDDVNSSVFWTFEHRKLLLGGSQSYENPTLVINAILEAQCDSAWLGWGFASERASFVSALEASGIIVLAPSPSTLEQVGDKGSARQYAEHAGFQSIPSLLFDFSDVHSLDKKNQNQLFKECQKLVLTSIKQKTLPPLPWILKATEGGGGRGIFKWTESDIHQKYITEWITESVVSIVRMGMKPRLILETCLNEPRHIELQLLGDGQGDSIIIGARECSVQRRHQKLIEECPPSNIKQCLIDEASIHAQNLARQLKYRGVGTIELLYSSQTEQLYFLEVNPRLQVEHPVTELVYGLDLVEEQIRIARGEPLPKLPSPRGVAIEARLYAEDPYRDFLPTSGHLARFRIPSGPGIRVDSGYQEGDSIATGFDPMLAKVIAYTPQRTSTILRLKQVLSSSQILIEGGAANHHYLKEILLHPEFQMGTWHTQKLYLPPPPSLKGRAIALLARGIDRYIASTTQGKLLSTQPKLISGELPLKIFRLGTERFLCLHERVSNPRHSIEMEWLLIDYHSLNSCAKNLMFNETSYHIEYILGDERYWVDGEAHDLTVTEDESVYARSRGVVLDLMVKPGDEVFKGQDLLKIESMKVEVCLSSPRDGVVSIVYCKLEEVVNPGDLLISLQPLRHQTVIQTSPLPWSTHPIEPLYLLQTSVLAWDFVPKHLWASLADTFNVEESQTILLCTEYFLDIAELFDRRSKDTPLARFENHALAAQPKRMIQAYLEGETDSLPHTWLNTLETCFSRLESQQEQSNDQFKEWACSRITHCASFLEEIAVILFEFLRRLDSLSLSLLDRLAALDPDRFPSLVGLAYEKSVQMSLEISSQRSNQEAFEQWLKHTGQHSINLSLNFEYEAAIAPLFEYAQKGNVPATNRLVEIFTASSQQTLLIKNNLSSQLILFLTEKRIVNFGTRPADTMDGIWLIYDQTHQSDQVVKWIANHIDTHIDNLQKIWILDISGQPIHTDIDNEDLSSNIDHFIKRIFIELHQHVHIKPMNCTVIGAPKYDGAIIGQSRTVYVKHLRYIPKQTLLGSIKEDILWRDLTPRQIERINAGRWSRFFMERRISDEYAIYNDMQQRRETFSASFQLVGKHNSEDVRIVTYAEVYQLNRRRGRPLVLPEVDHAFYVSLRLMHKALREQKTKNLFWNRLILRILPPIPLGLGVIKRYMSRLVTAARWVGLEKVIVRARFLDKSSPTGLSPLMDVSIYQFVGREVSLVARPSHDQPILTRTKYESQVVSARKRGLTHPAEVIHLLEGGGSGIPRGHFTLFDYDIEEKTLLPISTEKIFGVDNENRDGQIKRSKCGVFIGEIYTKVHKPQMTLHRVVILSDPTIKLAALGYEECERIIAALHLASERQLPIEWLTVSSGAKIDWETGTENLDACAKVLKEIIRFTHNGGMINILVTGTSVGAQSYWNAEATMMNHCCGTLIMTDSGSMVLTGKKALDISGCVSASDDLELGGYTSIMGPNGQAQIHALDLVEAYQKLYSFYRLCYLAPRQKRVNRRLTKDIASRDIGLSPYPSVLNHGFTQVNQIFSKLNHERKKAFAIKPIMNALKDHDDIYLERWGAWEGAETVVVWQSRLAGYAITMIGIENQSIQRLSASTDGPKQWQGGTLYPQASRKLARALNASCGRYPVVILANLSGFDGSPESLRLGQLEYGSEIAQAVQRFTCPIYFIILSRYHGGAYVVFSKQLNSKLEAIAIEGSFASVIGGGPAASIIFKRDVRKLSESMNSLEPDHRKAAKMIAQKFDQTHNIQRALKVGSIDQILKLSALRSTLSHKLKSDYHTHHTSGNEY